MFQIGIVGLPNVGKSTLFNILTKKQVDIQNYPFTTIEPNIGVVKVPDERLDILTKLSHSAKTIPTIVEFIDIAGLVKGAAQGEGLGNQFLSHIRKVDAIAHIVRAFQSPNIIHVDGKTDPARDIGTINVELIMADLQTVEKLLEKSRREAKANEEKKIKRVAILENLQKNLSAGKLALTVELSPEDRELIKDVNLITAKPVIIVLNVDEALLADEVKLKNLEQEIARKTNQPESHILSAAIRFEQDLEELQPEEREKYKAELGLSKRQSGLDLLIKKSYEILDLITFFTTGEDETRAWTITRGSSAPKAGSKIHSDFEEKFIRAEVISYKDFVAIGTMSKARETGALKIVGKDYIVQDGDIIEFKI